MTNAIKPCPFCGGEAKIDYHEAEYKNIDFDYYEIKCVNPKCRVYAETDCESTLEDAVEAWNQRAERTCNPIWQPNEWGFSNAYCECGELLLQLLLCVPNGLGEALPNYCPNCGAKVVE